MSTSSTLRVERQKSHYLLPMLIIGSLFFIFGFVTWLNGALIPFLQLVCDLSETQALMVAFSFYVAYVVMALPMAWVLERSGYKNGMSIGLGLIALGACLFVPAAMSREFALFLFAQFVMGSGLTILQTASNPYIVKLGPEDSAAARIAVMGLLNKGAGALAPIVFTSLVLGDLVGISAKSLAELSAAAQAEQIAQMAQGLIAPYLGMAAVLLVLALALKALPLPDINLHQSIENQPLSRAKLWHYPQLMLGAVALFCYVGAEVIAGDTIGLYGSKLGVPNATALTSYTMLAMVLGYCLGLLLIPRWLNQAKALALSAGLGVLLSIGIVFSNAQSDWIASLLWGWTGIASIPNPLALVAILGFANAMVWPAIWPLALADLGPMTARGSAVLIMGIAGGALLPLIYGLAADHWDNQSAYLVILPCYLTILFFAVKGHRLRNWT